MEMCFKPVTNMEKQTDAQEVTSTFEQQTKLSSSFKVYFRLRMKLVQMDTINI